MLGFLLSKAASYTGFDVDERTHVGVSSMFSDLNSLASLGKTANLMLQPFEDSALKPGSFDFALTSPPYFNVEKYDGELSSWRRYPTFETWLDGFYAPLIRKTAKALKRLSMFCLQIGNQSYPLEENAKKIAATCGLEFIETRSTGMTNNQAGTATEDGEVIAIFQRRR